MLDKYLPLGSVVLLEGGEQGVMIIGRGGRQLSSDTAWDYLACPYPEGLLGRGQPYLFNHGQIERLFFVGFQDGEELAFQKGLRAEQSEGDAAPASGHSAPYAWKDGDD